MTTGFLRVFTLEVDGCPTLAFEATTTRQAQELCKETWLLEDLGLLTCGGVPLGTAQSKLSVRPATSEEAAVFSQFAKTAKPSDDLTLAYLVNLDGREERQP